MTTAQIRKEVIKVLREILSDPDTGLHLTAYAKRRLVQSKRSAAAGKLTSLKDVVRAYRR